MAIRLQETLRAVFYAPFYIALARGAYAAEGVEVRFVSAPSPGQAAHGLFDGSVDVCWGGPMRVMQTNDRDPASDLVCFSEVVTRDPFFLIGRKPAPGFTVRDLAGKRFGIVSEVPTPWLCLQHDLRLAGVDPASLEVVSDRSMADNAAALLRGDLDVAQLFQPYVEELLDAGAHLWHAQASRGHTAYTCFYTRSTTLRARADELAAMVRAIYRTQKNVARATGEAMAVTIAPFFPAVSSARLARACRRYQDLRIWGHDPILSRAGYDRLRDSLLSGGFVRTAKGYDEAVENSFAQAAIAADPPALE
jgi:NitT/TauT family transport system substrate-binding protein